MDTDKYCGTVSLLSCDSLDVDHVFASVNLNDLSYSLTFEVSANNLIDEKEYKFLLGYGPN